MVTGPEEDSGELSNQQLQRREKFAIPEHVQPGSAEGVWYRLRNQIYAGEESLNAAKAGGGSSERIEKRIKNLGFQQETLESVKEINNANHGNLEGTWDSLPVLTASNILHQEISPQMEEELKGITDPQLRAEYIARMDAAWDLDGMLIQELLNSQSQETKSVQKKPEDDTAALEKRAVELATVTRTIGKGQLHGFVYPIDRSAGMGSVRGMGFSQGKAIERDPEGYKLLEQELRPRLPHRDINDGRWNEQRQVWMVSEHNGQTQYTYYMPTETTWDTRPGIMVELNVSLPNNVALQVDQMVERDPRFPDMYFKALFPDAVGDDPTNKIKRKEAIDLAIVDGRKSGIDPSYINTAEIKPYPKPIPY